MSNYRDRSIDISFELIAVVFDLSSCIRYANEYILFNKSRMFATGTYYTTYNILIARVYNSFFNISKFLHIFFLHEKMCAKVMCHKN